MTRCAQPFDGCSHGLRSEGAGAGREATAVGVGVFIGCLPLYGFHLVLCWITGWLFGLNRLKILPRREHFESADRAPAGLRRAADRRLGPSRRLPSADPADGQDHGPVRFRLDILTGSLTIGASLGGGARAGHVSLGAGNRRRCPVPRSCARHVGSLHRRPASRLGVRAGQAAR